MPLPDHQPATYDDLGTVIAETLPAVAQAIHPLTARIDLFPKGLEAVVLSAALRAYADVIEMRFEEGNDVGPLKTAVDQIRQQLTVILQEGAR